MKHTTETEKRIPIHPSYGENRFATDIRFTSTGPEALIDGKWFSVNGNANEIMDIRYEIRP